ncbi:MAG: 3-phosphoshikimate 1-carboxyvinyltransferase [Methanobacteriaceae archaeon]
MILKVKKTSSNVNDEVHAPPSKSYTHRAIIMASIANEKSTIHDPLLAEDTLSTLEACKSFGAKIDVIDDTHLEITGFSGKLSNSKKVIDLGNSGTTLRIMTSLAGLSYNETIFTGDDSLKTRPMKPLLDALANLGLNAYSVNIINNVNDSINVIKNYTNKAPILVENGFVGGKTSISGDISSQFISSILIAGALALKGVELHVTGEFLSKPYVDMTIDIMEKFGVNVTQETLKKHDICKSPGSEGEKCATTLFKVKKQEYNGISYTVEGDYSSASYILSATAILGGKVKINNLFKDSKQGDKLILNILEKMGAKITRNYDNVILESDGKLDGIDIDLHNSPDLLPTVAVLGALATGKTTITGVKHARLKETDRIATCASELIKLGFDVVENDDGMVIGDLKDNISKSEKIANKVTSHKDHRLAMSFSLIGLKYGIEIEDGEVFSISFPNYIQLVCSMGLDMGLV